MRFIFLFLLSVAFALDFDCIVIGTSPFSLFEALYQHHSGNRVLILEQADECGGAWKGISVCGVAHADLGCHHIGNDMRLKTFLEVYAGCKIVSLDNPQIPFEGSRGSNGWYFSKGCYELIGNLLTLISLTDITLLTHCKAESISVDMTQKIATVKTFDRYYTTKKVIVTPTSCFDLQPARTPQSSGKSRYYHLYLLIQDPTPPRFSYSGGLSPGVSRIMNLSHFTDLVGTGRQLLVIQTHGEQYLSQGQSLLDAIKRAKLVDPGAYLLQSEPYIYEVGSFHQSLISKMGASGIVEILHTGHFQNLSSYISKWEKVLKPFTEISRNPQATHFLP